jgi:hypothetical protein
MTLYEKYGLIVPLQRYLDDLKASSQPGQSAFSAQIVASAVPLARFRIAVCAYLMGNLVLAKKHGACVGKATVNYFYGSWRSKVKTDSGTVDPDWWHGRINWMTHFSVAVCWASAIGDWKTANRVAEYPRFDCIIDPSMTKEDKAAYLVLADYLRKKSPREWESNLAIIRNGKKQKPKLLANVIKALEANESKSFQDSLDAYLEYFRTSEFRRTSLDRALCYDGSSLLNLGQRNGISFKMREEFKDYFIRL